MPRIVEFRRYADKYAQDHPDMARVGEQTRASFIVFFVNGHEVLVENPDPEMTLLTYLRRHCTIKLNHSFTGTKLGCGEGGCGACTVMVSQYDKSTDTIRHYTVNACLAPLCSIDGLSVITVEGIGNSHKLHPCQERIAKAHGSQCGFCTPGFVMSMYTLLRNKSHPTQEDMEHAFEGNLCRCTGYRAILDGYRTFCSDCPCRSDRETQKLFDAAKFIPHDPTQEVIFPAKLKSLNKPLSLEIKGRSKVTWYRPVTMEELLDLVNCYPNNPQQKPQHRLVIGNTEVEIERRQQQKHYPVLICPSHIPELLEIELTDDGLLVGASVTLTVLKDCCSHIVSSESMRLSGKTGVFEALVEMLRWFAGPQIRNVSSLAGNIITASPISDLNPILLACKARLNLISIDGERTLEMDPTFFTGYRRTALKPNEILKSVVFPYTKQREHVMAFKQARRREDDISIVNSCMFVRIAEDMTVECCRLAFGGMNWKTITAPRTQTSLLKRLWNKSLLEFACSSLADELVLDPTVPGGMPSYRLSLTLSFFNKFYLSVLQKHTPDLVTAEELSAFQSFQKDVSRGAQGFSTTPASSGNSIIGQPQMHTSAIQQATGEAKYIDDLPHFENELYAGLILSTKANAQYTLDTSALRELKDEVHFVCASDVPGLNDKKGSMEDEMVFREGTVTSIGQIIAIVLAKNKLLAQRYARLVKVEYTEYIPVFTIEEAIANQQFLPEKNPVHQKLSCGDAEKALASSTFSFKGSMRTGAQEHFYLETNACIAIPKGENGEMELIASTQGASDTQFWTAEALGISAHKVVVKVKRIGGGFGGKETRTSPLIAAIAVAANKVGRPVRIMLDRNEDMVYSGHRHPFLGRYEVGCTAEGKLTALELELYSNGGHSTDLSIGVLARAMTHSTNAYYVPNANINGRACRTNLPSNTAFRGFGAPQAMIIMEDIMDKISYSLKLDPVDVREINLVKDGQQTLYGFTLNDCHMVKAWKKLLQDCKYYERREQVLDFNRENKWKKRGLAIIPTKYGIAFGLKHLNQAGALVLVYRDGSVLLTHGGMEMGQGLHTKMIQVCSRCLDIPISKIYLTDTSTDKVPNSSPTASSTSSDLYGMAVKDACDQIVNRLRPFKEKEPDAGWDHWVQCAYKNRVNLSAQGFYKTEYDGIDWDTEKGGKGQPYNYYCYGVGCSEVEVDTLTGDFKILRSDLLMDVGDSLNPAIDIGQVEGAFTQGIGLFTMEECVFLKDGKLHTKGPGTYKIPSCNDIPIVLNVSLMDSTPNPRAIFNSKAVGEPPLFLAGSVFFAIKDAIRAARTSRGHSAVFDLQAPATAERIRLACEDDFTKLANQKMKEKHDNIQDRWNVIP